jgi:hypothetical protein
VFRAYLKSIVTNGKKKKRSKHLINFHDIKCLAFGEFGMDRKQYLSTTWSEFQLKCEGYFNREQREWQRVRVAAYVTYCAFSDSKARESIYDWMPLSSDPTKKEREKTEVKEIQKEIREQERKYKKYFG